MGSPESKPVEESRPEAPSAAGEEGSRHGSAETTSKGGAGESRAGGDAGEGGQEGSEDADEEYECPMCTFMKGGQCKEEFLKWEECVDCVREQGGNMAEECGQLFMDMNECMLKHKDYYAPILALHDDVAEEMAEREGEEVAAKAESEQAKKGGK